MSNYSCILGQEMEMYLDLLVKSTKYTAHVKSLFKELDQLLLERNPWKKELSQQVVFEWDSGLKCSPATRKKKYTALRGFMKFLSVEGIPCEIPEVPRKKPTEYTPYIFNETEWKRIIQESDNLASSLKHPGSDMPVMFPLVIRLLYTCGLRLSEALSLKSGDIDFEIGCLVIRKAKRKRQRVVPMKQSMTDVLKKYCLRLGILQKTNVYLFAGTDDKPHSHSWVERWFSVTLERCGIMQQRNYAHERGICPHCLRHTFAFRSFQNWNATFEDMVPFLSTYLGHNNIMETDRYLRFSYELYDEAHKKISNYTEGLFPEVTE